MEVLALFNHQIGHKIVSGGERLFLDLSKEWIKHDVKLEIILSEITKKAFDLENINAEFHTYNGFKFEKTMDFGKNSIFIFFLVFFIWSFRTIVVSFLILTKLKNRNFRVIYTTADFFVNAIPATIFKLMHPKTNWFALIHHIIENPMKRKGTSLSSNLVSYVIQRFSFILIKTFADYVLVKNSLVKKELIENGFKKEKIFISYNGLNISKIENTPIHSSAEDFDACYLGRLVHSKGIFDLIDIWDEVVKTNKYAKLAIVGGASLENKIKLESRVKDRNLENNIRVFGYLPDNIAYSIRKSSKIFISPSYEEGWGISIAESMACKKAIVAYDLPVYKEVFKGVIKVAPIGNIEKFSENILELLSDNSLRISLGERGYKIIQNYDIKKIAEKEVDLMKN